MQMTEYELISLADLKLRINPEEVIIFDSETIGLYGRIRLAQFYQGDWEKALIVEYPNPYELASLLNDLHVVIHNAHYDITTIQEQIGKIVWMPKKFECTFFLGRLYFYKEDSFSLDNIIQYVLGFNPYGDSKKEMQASDWAAPVLSEKQLSYAASDVVYLYQVYQVVRAQAEDINYKLDILSLKYCLDFQNNGMPIEVEKLQARYAKNMKRINEIDLKINCNSYQQVRKYINSNLSDDAGLAVLSSQGNQRAIEVREVRKLTKNNSFLTKFLNTMIDGVIYGKFKLSTRSGRSSSDDQNLQQLPRTLKEIFGVDPDGDEVLIFSDFAQIQLRAVCVVTADKAMEALFRTGADLHNYVAEMIFGKDFTDEHRQICKTANFALLFGAGLTVFLMILLKNTGLVLTEEQGAKIVKTWKKLWMQITQWQDKGIKDWRAGRPWSTPLGRRYTSRMMTDQLAMQIQGFEAEVAKLAMHYMIPKLRELDDRIKLRNFIHDSYIFTAPKDPIIYEAACRIIAECMQEAWFEMCQSVAIKDLAMPTKVRVGFNWGDMEKAKVLGQGYIYELSI